MKKLLMLILTITLALTLFGCYTSNSVQSPAASPTLSLSPTSAPLKSSKTVATPMLELNYSIIEKDTHPQGVAMLAFADMVEKLSDGTIKVNTYHSGELFPGALEFVEILKNGYLDIADISFSDFSPYLPEASMFAAPYVLGQYDSLDTVFNSDAIQSFYNKASVVFGFTPIGYISQGYRTLNSRFADPIVTPADLKGFNLRMPGGESWTHMGQSLGADVVNFAYAELYQGLQSGLCDGQDNPYAGDVAMKFYEVTKQISTTYHLNDVKLICVSNKLWDTLNDEQKQWFYEAAKYAGAKGTQATIDGEAANLKIMTDYGLFVTEADRAAFAEYSHQYYFDNGLTTAWDMNLYNTIMSMN